MRPKRVSVLILALVMALGLLGSGCEDIEGSDGVPGMNGLDGASGPQGPQGETGIPCAVGNEGCVNINSDDISDGSIINTQLADFSVSRIKIVTGAVGSQQLGPEAVTTAKIAQDAVESYNILDRTVTNMDLAREGVWTENIAYQAVTTLKIAPDTINTSHIQDGQITNAKILDNTIQDEKIVSLDGSKIIPGTFDAAGITPGTIYDIHLNTAAAINGVKIGGNIDGSKINDNTLSGAKITDGTITSADIADLTIATIDIGNSVVTSAKIFDETIISADIADGTITGADILNSTITGADILDLTVNTADLTDLSVTTAKLAAGAVDGMALGNNVVEWRHLMRGSIMEVWHGQWNNSDTLGTGDNFWSTISNMNTGVLCNSLADCAGKKFIVFAAVPATAYLDDGHEWVNAWLRLIRNRNGSESQVQLKRVYHDISGLGGNDDIDLVQHITFVYYYAAPAGTTSVQFYVQWYMIGASTPLYAAYFSSHRTLTVLEF